MTKRSKLVKRALKDPDHYTEGELSYFSKWLEEHKRAKREKKVKEKEDRSRNGPNDGVDFS